MQPKIICEWSDENKYAWREEGFVKLLEPERREPKHQSREISFSYQATPAPKVRVQLSSSFC